MRSFLVLWSLLSLAILAAAQDKWVPPGNYAQPFIPRVSTPVAGPEALATPSLPLNSFLPSEGATNATAGNIAGAANSTLSIVSGGPALIFHRISWYGPGIRRPADAAVSPPASQSRPRQDWGAAVWQSGYGVAQLTAGSRASPKARRVYGNADIARTAERQGFMRMGNAVVRSDRGSLLVSAQ